MIADLAFDPAGTISNGARLERAAFRVRSRLPASAACLVANGVRETLQRLLGLNRDVRVSEPVVPDERRKTVLFARAIVYRVGGSAADAFLVLRIADALGLTGIAFGETDRTARDRLSAIELATLDRIAHALATQCGALCGTAGPARREPADRAQRESTTYFEVHCAGAPAFGIGFALAAEPSIPPGPPLVLDGLLDVGLHAGVELARGTIDLGRLGAMVPGDVIPLDTALDEPGSLLLEDLRLAAVACGDEDGRRAVRVCAA
jgi:flagellar motor switch/type III secretory pathway protein FliN